LFPKVHRAGRRVGFVDATAELFLLELNQLGTSFVGALQNLLTSLDADIVLRNQPTHDKFLSVGIWTNNDLFDPPDALLDVNATPEDHRQLWEFLSIEIQRLVDEHLAKGRCVFDATWGFLKVAQETK